MTKTAWITWFFLIVKNSTRQIFQHEWIRVMYIWRFTDIYYSNKWTSDVLQPYLPTHSAPLPKTSSISRAANLQHQKQRFNDPNSIYFYISYDSIPDNLIKYDLKLDEARHLLMYTDVQMDLLISARQWHVDATLKVVRCLFYQLLSFHSFLRSGDCTKQVPLLFTLMNHRRKDKYYEIIKNVKSLMQLEPDVEEVIMMDFESATWGAVRAVHLHVCTVHWARAVYRHMSQLGLLSAIGAVNEDWSEQTMILRDGIVNSTIVPLRTIYLCIFLCCYYTKNRWWLPLNFDL